MRMVLVLLACLFGFCFGGWTNPKCYKVWDIKLDLAKKSDFGKKDYGMGEACFWLGTSIQNKYCSCIETIDCGDGETKLCALHKCANLNEPVSIFNPADVQRFIVNLGGGGSNGGSSGQPLETK